VEGKADFIVNEALGDEWTDARDHTSPEAGPWCSTWCLPDFWPWPRDIHKSISVAKENGYSCIPIVIAESWGGDLKSLHCENLIYIQANPNQTDEIGPKLATELESLLPVWRGFSEES